MDYEALWLGPFDIFEADMIVAQVIRYKVGQAIVGTVYCPIGRGPVYPSTMTRRFGAVSGIDKAKWMVERFGLQDLWDFPTVGNA